ncbi:transposase [Microcoleus sp. POL8_C6]|uniref:transposase n=1 Tax=Microcoleus sp. Pol8_C1 TaxID=2818896 RepID=UPI002FD6F591
MGKRWIIKQALISHYKIDIIPNHAQIFFRESASTIENYFEGICNYFLDRTTTSGVMEGINNPIKLIMQQWYGLSNFNNFRNRVLACFFD